MSDPAQKPVQPFVNALIVEPLKPTLDDRTRGEEETKRENWLLGRACANAVVLAVGL